MAAALFWKGFLLGLSVAWPPGPINAEMIRRGLERGFLPAWAVGLGACSGDFLWALAVALGAGALVTLPGVRPALGVVGMVLLLFLAWTFGRGAWRDWQASRRVPEAAGNGGVSGSVPVRPARFSSTPGGYLLGLTVALSSPWNITFWLGVIGGQATEHHGMGASFYVAIGVVVGAALWGSILCGAVQWGRGLRRPHGRSSRKERPAC